MRSYATPLMALAQIALGVNALVIHYDGPRALTVVLPIVALTLVTTALVVWRTSQSGGQTSEAPR